MTGGDKLASINLSERQLATLAVFSDTLIPEDDEFPSATSADPTGRHLARALELIPRQGTIVAALLERVDIHDPEGELHRLERQEPEAFWALLNLVFGTYLTNRRIWKRLGYPGRRPAPPYPDEADFYLSDGLLGPVLTRGPFFRPTRAE